MSQIRIDSRLEEELTDVYEHLTGKEGKKIVEFLKANMQSGKTFDIIKQWAEETIPESNESKFQKKIVDVLCDYSILNSLPNEIREYVKKVVNRAGQNEKDSLEQIEDINNTARRLDKFIDMTRIIRGKFQKLDDLKVFSVSKVGGEYKTKLEIGEGATTVTFFTCIVLIAHYCNGIL